VTVNKSKQDIKQRTTEIASNIYSEYLKNILSTNYTRSLLIELKSIVDELNEHFATSSLERSAALFLKLKEFLRENTSLSVYELASSGLVDVLLKIFRGLSSQHQPNDLVVYQRAHLFCSIFLSDEQPQAFHTLVRKLLSLLESIEKSPLFLYDTSLNFGLQIFSKRFRLRIQYHDEQHLFTDRTGKALNMEPLATVGQLKTFLASMVSKQWFDHPHSHLEFVKQLKSAGRLTFNYTSDFDQDGVLYWVGTNGKTQTDYTNPASTGLVSISCSELNRTAQQLASIIAHQDEDDHDEDDERHFTSIVIDLGLLLIPSHFTLRYHADAPSQWKKTISFQVSKHNFRFITCDATLLNETASSTATWTVRNSTDNSSGYRYLRINSKAGRHLGPVAGLEVYGQVLSAVDIRSSKFFSPHVLMDK
jgi:E3 ubiquitin-protein ligase HECTD1